MVELELGLLADGASIDSSGKFYIMGEFRYLFVDNFPAFHPQMTLVLRLVAPTVEIPKGRKAKMRLQFVDADGQPLLPQDPPVVEIGFGPIGPADRGMANAQVVMNMGGLPIRQEGDHVIHVWVEDRRVGEVKFHVVKKPPPQTAATIPPPAGAS